MKIIELKYYDDEYKWRLEPVKFNPNLNLLVGLSGAGKTRILKAIESLKDIANGSSINGIEWDVRFVDEDNSEYHWSGKFETTGRRITAYSDLKEKDSAKIVCEKLICGRDNIIDRTQDRILLNGIKTPKLSPYMSVIELLKEEEVISPIKKAMDKLILTDSDPNNFSSVWELPTFIIERYHLNSLSAIRESSLPIAIRLAILTKIVPEEFKKIKQAFINIFPNVLDLRVEEIKDDDLPLSVQSMARNFTAVSIKEKGIDDWFTNISSGMLKTLMYISELYLLPENSLILIDEFENSLGINCLDSVMELIASNHSSQFMIASHHPYIINNISPANWKIVTRHGSNVIVKNAKDFHISDSRQKAFIDLINVLEDDGSED
jgi:predicted ATP-dependent endonuclease of OLD family